MKRPFGCGVLLLCIAGVGCRPAPSSSAPIEHPVVVNVPQAAPLSEPIDVSVELRGPTRVRYEPSILAAARPTVRVIVRNRGKEPLDASNLRVRLNAARDGVGFPCAREVGPPPRSREREYVAAGGEATFERNLDCELPLVGNYKIDLVVAFGRTGSWSTGQVAHTLALQVVSSKGNEPHELSALHGVWAAIGASRTVPAASGEVASKLGVSFVNGSSRGVDVGPVRLALRVYRNDASIPCEDEPVSLNLPARLEPGQSHVEVIGVSCLGLHVTGRYDVVGRIILIAPDGRPNEQEIGRMRVEVSSDPLAVDRGKLGPPMR